MLTRLSLLTFRDGASDADKRSVVETVQGMTALASPAAGTLVADDLPSNRNGGDVIWRLEFATREDHDALVDSAAWRDGQAALDGNIALGSADSVVYEPLAVGERGANKTGGLYRLLLFAIDEGTPAGVREEFEAAMAAMPSYVSTILRWNFGKVVEGSGARRWTYLWEQEYTDIAGFRGEYMAHPYHWGYLDRWYDSDNPVRIVDPYLCNSFCTIETPVMFTRLPRPEARPFPG